MTDFRRRFLGGMLAFAASSVSPVLGFPPDPPAPSARASQSVPPAVPPSGALARFTTYATTVPAIGYLVHRLSVFTAFVPELDVLGSVGGEPAIESLMQKLGTARRTATKKMRVAVVQIHVNITKLTYMYVVRKLIELEKSPDLLKDEHTRELCGHLIREFAVCDPVLCPSAWPIHSPALTFACRPLLIGQLQSQPLVADALFDLGPYLRERVIHPPALERLTPDRVPPDSPLAGGFGAPLEPPSPPPVPVVLFVCVLLIAFGRHLGFRARQRVASGKGASRGPVPFAEALRMMEDGNHSGAILSIQSEIRKSPEHGSRGRVLLACCFARTGMVDLARDELRNLDAANVPLEELYEAAQSLESLGYPTIAQPLYRSVARVDMAYRDVRTKLQAQSSDPSSDDSTALPSLSLPTRGTLALPARYVEPTFLARGGMGVVYRAWDSELERPVAIKIIEPGRQGDADACRRFGREARAMARLSHPAIVSVYDVCRDPPYLVMEFLEGASLAELLRREGLLDLDRSLKIAVDLCHALSHAHQMGVVHRDLKPGNILITEDGSPKILDFGLARFRADSHITRAGVVIGTPDYIAPEILSGNEPSPKSDIFALGVVLHDLLTGNRVKVDSDGIRIMSGRASRAVAVAPEVLEVIGRMLSTQPEARPDDLEQIADLIGRARESTRPDGEVLGPRSGPAVTVASGEPESDSTLH